MLAARFRGHDDDYHLRIDERRLQLENPGDLYNFAQSREFRDLAHQVYDRVARDHLMQARREEVMSLAREMDRFGVPAAAMMELQEQFMRGMAEAWLPERFIRRPPERVAVGWDVANNCEITEPERPHHEHVQWTRDRMTATEVLARQQQADDWLGERFAREIERHMADALMYGLSVGQTPTDPEAVGRAEQLLRDHLSDKQREQYDTKGWFKVRGCHTGHRYRIERGTSMNIYQLDRRGRQTARWCFGPKGIFTFGDAMLAQKIALETNENAALAVANRIS